MWSMIIGAVAGAVYNGVTTYQNNQKLAGAYQDYADKLKDVANKYSGEAAYNKMSQAGKNTAVDMNKAMNQQASTGVNPFEFAPQDYTQEGYAAGSGYASAINNAQANKELAESQAKLGQAGTDFKVANQTQQAAMNTAGGLVDLYKESK